MTTLHSFLRSGLLAAALILLPATAATGQSASLWQIHEDGIRLDSSRLADAGHKDHYAMSGRAVDLILEWEIDGQGAFSARRWVRWPMLRMTPDNTHASFDRRFNETSDMRPQIGSSPLSAGRVAHVDIDGVFTVVSRHGEGVEMTRRIFPSSNGPAVIDLIEIANTSDKTITLTIPHVATKQESKPGVRGVFLVTQTSLGEGEFALAPGASASYGIIRSARLEGDAPYMDDPAFELAARRAFVAQMQDSLIMKTPSPVLDRMFAFAKIRAAESIFSTRGGLMHGPGGYNKFLAAIWTNDQAEYINPFFPFLGSKLGNESAMNCYRWFATYINPEFKAIPSSVISEGTGTWNGAGDRGDPAMYAYGAARFALASGNRAWTLELLPHIEWCLEYCQRQMLPEGVVASHSDELEGRFPSGKANLCTNILYYDALLSTAHIYRALDPASDKAAACERKAAALRTAVKSYFEGRVEGFDTYRYYEGNDVLRSWICMPLTAGMFERAGATTDALFSDKLWFGNGMLTASNTKTYWDRSALYAFRGIFAAGLQDRALPKLTDYSTERLLGSHVPYAIEAYPEANQSHLSAESGLYCRIFTEGLFGITPTGLRSCRILPRLPSGWNEASLQHIRAFGCDFNVTLQRRDQGIRVLVTDSSGAVLHDRTGTEGDAHDVTLAPDA